MRAVSIANRVAQWVASTVRIARWEVASSADTIDRRTVLFLVVMVAVASVGGIAAVDAGAGLDDDIYAVAVEPDSPYEPVIERDDRLDGESATYEAFLDGTVEADVYVGQPGHLEHDGTNTGEAAYDTVRDAVERYNEAMMASEPNESAAYPVTVAIAYEQRGTTALQFDGDQDRSENVTGDDEPDEDGTGDDSGEDDRADGADGDVDDDSAAGIEGGEDDSGSGLGVPALGTSLGDQTDVGTPGSISPPFPFDSLLLAFLFVVPMNFVIQAYGSTILDERVDRRGELLLVAPVSRSQIVTGKTLPYLLALLAIVVAIAVVVGGGLPSVLAAVPIALLFLAATFVGAMLARSFKELTFVTVTISVVLTTYVFVPAIFTDVTPIALISPLTLVVMDLQGEAISVGQYLFSTGAFYLAAGVLFLFGLGSYREEDMFTQKSIPAKLIDVLVSRLHGYRSVPLVTVLFIPFVFAGQLLAVSLLFVVPASLALPTLLIVAAALEELAKSVHVYAGFARSRFEATLPVAVGVGALSGAGFFAGEKVTHLVQLVGLPELTVGEAVFGPALSLGPAGVLLFALPLVVHVVTAAISAYGASHGRTTYAAGFVVATLLHALYNAGVIALVG